MRLHDGAGGAIELGELLGRGGEGEVFTVVGQPALVAKVLQPARRTRAKHDKIAAMLHRPPAGAYDAPDGLPVLSWPKGLLYSSPRAGPGTFAGYTMTRIQRRDFVPFYRVTTAARRQRLGGDPVTWDRLVLLGARLCHVVRTLHSFGYAVGDLNDRNVLVSRRFTPLLMDTDSFQVPKRGGHFPSTVGDQLYWAPELLGVDLATHKKSRIEGDRFALATLLFQLFMDGNRPYQARGSQVDALDTLMEKTQAGHFPWETPRPGVLEPPAGAPAFANLPAALQKGFRQAFVAGHREPKRRPTAEWWYQGLAKLAQEGFQACAAEARHAYGAQAKACPWCADANDPFTASSRKPRRVRAPPKPRPVASAAAATSKAPATVRTTPPSRTAKPAGQTASRRPPAAMGTGSAKPIAAASPPSNAIAKPAKTRKAQAPAKLVAPKPVTSKPPRTRVHPEAPPPTNRLVAVAWLMAVALALLAPVVWIWQPPAGVEKHVIAASLAIAATVLPVAWWAWRHAGDPRKRAAVACGWTLIVAAGAAWLAAADGWLWLELVAGAACLALGAVVFVRLEQRRGDLLHPEPRSLANAAAGLPIAYLPMLAWWVWML